MPEKQNYTKDKTPYTFIDLFAGAGGISEGFLQAEYAKKIFDFILASDINENCELTHLVRYNYQLGLSTKFLKGDIMDAHFIDNLVKHLDGTEIDVVTGGPSCQSFSLSGRRKKYDKRDDLFTHYLKVIQTLKPKYFVMENVTGLLTKGDGEIRNRILNEIKSIIDTNYIPEFIRFIENIKSSIKDSYLLDCYKNWILLNLEQDKEQWDLSYEKYIQNIENSFKSLTKELSLNESKSAEINTIRHGLSLIKRKKTLDSIKKKVINLKTLCDIDNDDFVDNFNSFLENISIGGIINVITEAFKKVVNFNQYKGEVDKIIQSIEIIALTNYECIESIKLYIPKKNRTAFNDLSNNLLLYRIDKPIVVNAINYGVPQNRERVLFIGCRKDQNLIKKIPTPTKSPQVTVYEALFDLDFIGNGTVKTDYGTFPDTCPELLKRLSKEGNESIKGKTYAQWSRQGRLTHRFDIKPPIYVKTIEDYHGLNFTKFSLHNHQTSLQSPNVVRRLQLIVEAGSYSAAKEKLKKEKLESKKRNYTILNKEGQSPTVVTLPDDFIHYSQFRLPTVREMARLQSFDDDFVFQGKRTTGGDKRKDEVPQYTLVGNAVPPLLAKAIGKEILRNIK